MRFKLILEADLPRGNQLPLNYQYELSSWIYKTISFGDPAFSAFLHQRGFLNKEKGFKLFCFSRLVPVKFRVIGDRMKFTQPQASLILSFLPVEALEPFIRGLFSGGEFAIGDTKSKVFFTVKTVERLPDPVFSQRMIFRFLSPVLLVKPRPGFPGKVDHLWPDHPDYEHLFINNLAEKYNAYFPPRSFNLTDAKLEIISNVQSKLATIKTGTPQETMLKCFLYDFRLTAPVELIKTGYYAGFGKENSQGFGCGEVMA
ncbi:MAG: CRISPR-associated endoribonuclease Cas6 [Bacteroidetes bacterium]|nr:CRISPR-associated endoribonuclease Cas6 [Bacteroidota bacterium]